MVTAAVSPRSAHYIPRHRKPGMRARARPGVARVRRIAVVALLVVLPAVVLAVLAAPGASPGR